LRNLKRIEVINAHTKCDFEIEEINK